MTDDRLAEIEAIQNPTCPCVECSGIRELVAEGLTPARLEAKT